MFSAKNLVPLQHSSQIQLWLPRGRESVSTSPHRYPIFCESLLSSWRLSVSPDQLAGRMQAGWGSGEAPPLSSPAGHLAASRCDPSCNFFTRPPPSRRSGPPSGFAADHTKAEGRRQSEATWNRTNAGFFHSQILSRFQDLMTRQAVVFDKMGSLYLISKECVQELKR